VIVIINYIFTCLFVLYITFLNVHESYDSRYKMIFVTKHRLFDSRFDYMVLGSLVNFLVFLAFELFLNSLFSFKTCLDSCIAFYFSSFSLI